MNSIPQRPIRQVNFLNNKVDFKHYSQSPTLSRLEDDKTNSCSTQLRKFYKVAKPYMKNSTLHGLPYVADDSISYGERFVWLIAFVIATSFAIYFSINIYVKYSSIPVIVSMNPLSTSVEKVPFPAVTICNMNMVLKSEAEFIIANGSYSDKDFLDEVCGTRKAFLSSPFINNDNGSWNSLYKFMQKVSPPCEKFLMGCSWRMQETSCEKLFFKSITDHGLCCTFNMLPWRYILRKPDFDFFYNTTTENQLFSLYEIDDWTPERGYASSAPYDIYPFRSPGSGAHLGLSIVLDTDIDNYYCSASSSTGFKMLLHNPAEIPQMTDYAFMLPPGCEVRIVFKPTINDATEDLRTMDVKKRGCYFNNERYLKYYRWYSKNNCKLECLTNITLQRCGCVPYYLPRIPSTKICGLLEQDCAKNVKEMIDLNEIPSAEELRCNCLSSCFQINYDKSMSYSRIGDELPESKDFLGQSISKDLVITQLYFVNTEFSKFTKSQLFGFSEFLSNIGGILSLFLGLSILSLVELVYYITLRAFCGNIRRKRNVN